MPLDIYVYCKLKLIIETGISDTALGSVPACHSPCGCRQVAAGELAQMGERSLSMREVPGSIPGFSKILLLMKCVQYSMVNAVGHLWWQNEELIMFNLCFL